jgi:hypothetical protein
MLCIVLVLYILYFYGFFGILLSFRLSFGSMECVCVGRWGGVRA